MKISNMLLTQYPGEVSASHNELIPFAARILGRQRGLESTVEALPSKFHRDSLSHELAVVQNPETLLWGVYDCTEKLEQDPPLWKNEKHRLHETKRAAKAAAWMVRNGLCGGDFEINLLKPKENGLSSESFTEFLGILDCCFPPFSFRALDPDTIWSAGAQGPVLIAINFEDPQESSKILNLDAVYRTGWGEIRHQFFDVSHISVEADKYMTLSELITKNCGVTDATKLTNGTPNPSNSLKKAFLNLKGVMAANLARSAQKASTGSPNRIDL
jgi:hypothetical protein